MTIDPPPAQFSAAAAPTDESPALVARRDAFRINGLEFDYGCNPIEGEVHWDPVRSLFNGTMLLLAMTLGPMYFSWPAVAVFLVLCFFTLDTVEKLENCGALCFRYWNKISKTTAKFARPDLQAHQDREKRSVATPSARISKTFSMGRKFLGQRQIGSFSTVSGQGDQGKLPRVFDLRQVTQGMFRAETGHWLTSDYPLSPQTVAGLSAAG